MNWTWSLRAKGGMNGLEFSRALTAGGMDRVLVHAAPEVLDVEVVADDGTQVARGEVERQGEYSPMTELVLADGEPRRRELWPTDSEIGLPVLLPGGEAGILREWHHAPDRSWWRWSLELSNHRDRPSDWQPPESGADSR